MSTNSAYLAWILILNLCLPGPIQAPFILILRLEFFLFNSYTSECCKIFNYLSYLQTNFQATETLLTSEEAVIAAAAAEAVTLAKAAVKVAKDAALLLKPHLQQPTICTLSSEANYLDFKKTIQAATLGDSTVGPEFAHHSLKSDAKDSDDVGPTYEELQTLQEQVSSSIAVRSRRQTERKARRDRAAEKAAANVVSVKSGSNTRKKRASLQDVDHSDPLRYLRATTSTSRLLTANEEIELSEGIQVLLKLSLVSFSWRKFVATKAGL